MRLVVQRVSEASVVSDGVLTGRIGPGLMILCGVGPSDDEEAAKLLAKKAAELRIFSDKEGKMNLSVKDLSGEVLVVSQFTLFADIRKGRRPFFGGAAAPELANHLYEVFMDALRGHGLEVASGVFGADMQVSLTNDGPVTLWMDSDAL